MKTKAFYFLALIFISAGCSLIKDKATVSISTDIKSDIPMVVLSTGKKSFDLAGEVSVISFTKTQDLALADNVDIAPYLSKIKAIDLNSLVITITGLSTGQTINSVSLDVTGVGNIFTQTNITMTNNSFTPVITAGSLDLVATKFTNDKTITLTVYGSASGPMSFTVSLNFEALVTAYVL